MKNYFFRSIVFVSLLFFSSYLNATNELAVLTDSWGSSKPGYMDKVLLVIEPHGGYFEQSLYIEYSDHNVFHGSSNVEIVHRFELPEGSVINDMWLWIGDSVMQAIIMDTWTATSIYDSIVVNKRDPALLKKKGNQYELHVYPLKSGSFRKVKINIITPVKWVGENALAELPFRMLNSNNNSRKPLDVFFRRKNDSWGEPKITEFPENDFSYLTDTLGYRYSFTHLNDISGANSLKLSFSPSFDDGKFITGYVNKFRASFFQLGILPGEFFDLQTDLSPKKNLYAIDLSGNKNNDVNVLLPRVSDIMNAGMKEGDLFSVFVSGAQRIENVSDGWKNYSQSAVENILNDFQKSSFADSIMLNKKPEIIFCDFNASDGWDFNGIEDLANVQYFYNILSSVPYFTGANVIAAYRHGYDDPINEDQLNQMLTPLDSFFVKGGRLVTYFDRNRNEKELLARHYVNGLFAGRYQTSAQTLYRNDDGNFGIYFPEQFDHNFVYELLYDDPDVKIEVKTADGSPVIISKKIRNGLIVVSGIWQIQDDDAMKAIISPPLLGINKSSNDLLLPDLLTNIQNEYDVNPFDKCILFSNSDSIFTETPTDNFAADYLSGFNGEPVFNTINLLDGSLIDPPSIIIDNNLYYGSGYLLYKLSDLSGGLHFETYKNDWDYIASMSDYALNPLIDDLDINVTVDDGAGNLIEMREVNPVRNDPNKPLFFIAETDGQTSVDFNIVATFKGSAEPVERNFEFLFQHDSLKYEKLIPSLLANEELKDMFNEDNIDTLGIVNLAMKHNLLTDFTALLALEPNDTIHFMTNPFDESGITGIEDDAASDSDSLSVEVFPNPFNSLVNIKLTVSETSNIKVSVYNILGQKVIDLESGAIVENSYSLIWNGKNSIGQSVATGLYILRVEVAGVYSKRKEAITKKLLYLK
ncbi:MAG: T9SS type A sorting domain-containing protein [Chlorobi bacterium]|nr:T9SS type A sorting domain-containing protein [Chlorobiota bacterium]